MSPVTVPVFGSASANASAPADGAQAGSDWNMDTGGDPMDFDFLAEYLLDETPAGAPGIGFDFNPEASNSSNVPKQGVNGTHGVAQAQQIISQQAVQMQPVQPRGIPMAAPAPLGAPALIVAPQGIVLPPAPISYAQPRSHIAPAPAAPGVPTSNGAIAPQQPAAIKRRRIDAPAAVTSSNMQPSAMADTYNESGRGRKKTQAQIDRRRERNRILARRTRLRKKFFFESLQKEVVDLQRENAALKDIVRSELSESGSKILEECNASEQLPEGVIEACGENASDMGQQDFNLVKSIQQSQHSFIITDPSLQDSPIVFASDDFLSLTGYSREDVLGRNCRFLQGPATSKAKVEEIRKGLSTGSDISVTLVNYTADGAPFWNKLFIAPLRDAQDSIVNFIGVIVKVSSPEPDDPEHGVQLPAANLTNDLYDQADPVDTSMADGTITFQLHGDPHQKLPHRMPG